MDILTVIIISGIDQVLLVVYLYCLFDHLVGHNLHRVLVGIPVVVLASMPATATVWQEARKVPPAINLDTTDKAWNDFYMALLQYKDESAMVGQAITRQPYACCTTEQATSLSHTLSEAQLVEHMKALTVRYQNPAVHVHEFLGLSQQADERVRNY